MKRIRLAVALLMYGTLLAGCTTATADFLAIGPPATPRVGAAVSATVARQIADPVAGARDDSSQGLNGRGAKRGMDGYANGFSDKSPTPQPSILIQTPQSTQ